MLSQRQKMDGTIDFELHGLSDLLSLLEPDDSSITFDSKKRKAVILWNILKEHLERDPYFFDGQWYEFYRKQRFNYHHESTILRLLNENQWILTKDNELKRPGEITVPQLYEEFRQDVNLISALGIAEKDGESIQEEIREKYAEALGITLDDVDNIKLIRENPEEFERFKKNLSKGETFFPIKSVKNIEHRTDAIQEQKNQAEDKIYEVRERRVRVTGLGGDQKIFLEDNYTNEDGIMVCQICGGAMPFKKKDGTYYYEAVECLSRDHLKKEMPEQYLALCPECSAWYNEWILHNKEAMEELKKCLEQAETDNEENEIDLPNKAGNWRTIKFTERHLFDLKAILT
jgi:hypothetical protein